MRALILSALLLSGCATLTPRQKAAVAVGVVVLAGALANDGKPRVVRIPAVPSRESAR